jgi:hypothetical protein
MISRAAAPAATSGATAAPASASSSKIEEGRRPVRRLRNRPQGHVGHEAERALRPTMRWARICTGVSWIEEGVERVRHRLLARELGPDARGQRPVRPHLVAQGQEGRVQVGRAAAQVVVRFRTRGVELRPVREQEVERVQRVVAVLGHAAAHPGRVVGDDAADHAGVDGGGIGAQPRAEGSEHAVE